MADKRSLTFRFFHTLLQKSVDTMREGYFDKLILLGTLVYILVRGISTDKWDLIVPAVWGVCIIISAHGFGAARFVVAEIRQDEKNSEPKGFSQYKSVAVVPVFYKLRLYGLACILLLICGTCALLVWQFSVRHEGRFPITITVTPIQTPEIFPIKYHVKNGSDELQDVNPWCVVEFFEDDSGAIAIESNKELATIYHWGVGEEKDMVCEFKVDRYGHIGYPRADTTKVARIGLRLEYSKANENKERFFYGTFRLVKDVTGRGKWENSGIAEGEAPPLIQQLHPN